MTQTTKEILAAVAIGFIIWQVVGAFFHTANAGSEIRESNQRMDRAYQELNKKLDEINKSSNK